MSDTNKKVNISVSQIITTILILLVTGTLGYIGNDIADSLDLVDKNEKRMIEVEATIEKDIKPSLHNIVSSVKENKLRMGSMDASIRKLEIMTNRLEVIVDRLDKLEVEQ